MTHSSAAPKAQAVNMALGQLYTNEIRDTRILQAMVDVPRAPFLPENLRGAAYVDEDLDVGGGRYELAPLTLARLLALAELTSGCRVLCIGVLSGYGAAVVSRLASHVVAIETDAALVEQARAHMTRLAITNVNIQPVSSLAVGYAMGAPYNAIIVQGAIAFLPEVVGAQLALGGRLAAIRNIAQRPGMKGGLGKGLLVKRLDHKLQYREHFDAAGVVLPGFEREATFIF